MDKHLRCQKDKMGIRIFHDPCEGRAGFVGRQSNRWARHPFTKSIAHPLKRISGLIYGALQMIEIDCHLQIESEPDNLSKRHRMMDIPPGLPREQLFLELGVACCGNVQEPMRI
jgi:hypothetical protein